MFIHFFSRTVTIIAMGISANTLKLTNVGVERFSICMIVLAIDAPIIHVPTVQRLLQQPQQQPQLRQLRLHLLKQQLPLPVLVEVEVATVQGDEEGHEKLSTAIGSL